MFSPPIVSSSKAVGLTSVVLPKNQIVIPGSGTAVVNGKRTRVVRISKKNIRTPVVVDDQLQQQKQQNNTNPYENLGEQKQPVALPQQWLSRLPLAAAIHNEKSGTKRPSTPEEQRKNCLDCGNMKDFIFGLQREVKRLQVSFLRLLPLCNLLSRLFLCV